MRPSSDAGLENLPKGKREGGAWSCICGEAERDRLRRIVICDGIDGGREESLAGRVWNASHQVVLYITACLIYSNLTCTRLEPPDGIRHLGHCHHLRRVVYPHHIGPALHRRGHRSRRAPRPSSRLRNPRDSPDKGFTT